MKQLRRMRQHRCLSAKKTGAQRRRERGGGRIEKKRETEREAWRTRDRRPSISIALRLSLWLGFSVPFSHKSYIVSSLRSYGRGLKYSSFLPAARIHRKAGRRQTYRTWHTYAKSNSNHRRYHRQHRSLAYNPFWYIQCSSPTRYPFVAVYSCIGPPSSRCTRRVLFELNSVSSNWTVERIVCWSGNRAFPQIRRGFSSLFERYRINHGFVSNVDKQGRRDLPHRIRYPRRE